MSMRLPVRRQRIVFNFAGLVPVSKKFFRAPSLTYIKLSYNIIL